MASITQAPTELDVNMVASNPFYLLINASFTDSNDDPISWSEITDPVASVGNTDSLAPTITSPEDGQWLLSWTAAQTAALSECNWYLSATVSGSGPLTLIAGTMTSKPAGTPGSSAASSGSLAVSVGTTTVSLTAAVGSSGLIPSTHPTYYGYLGWTLDPVLLNNNNADTGGVITLIRMRCVKTGVCENIQFCLDSGGTNETSDQNFLGIYDTGQTTSGEATLLGQTADQSTNFASMGVITAALVSGVHLTAGQDYFLAFLENNSGTSPTWAAIPLESPAMINANLSPLEYRICDVIGPSTTLPATIEAASLEFTQVSYWYGLIAT